MDHILALHADLAQHAYRHGLYHAFRIADPKPRDIHKACVRDRLVHHAVYRVLYPFFDRLFIADSFSCRNNKGTHKALNRFRAFAYAASKNHTRTCWVLKCDIRKFFANINHDILNAILRRYIPDADIVWLLAEIIGGHSSMRPGIGLPLGNLTSQLFCNIYMNEFDRFAKHGLKAKYYIRYADDFVLLSEDKAWLENCIPRMRDFLKNNLGLHIHDDKLSIKTIASGIDFLGWVHFPVHRVLRRATRRRMMRNMAKNSSPASLASYRGLLRHGNGWKVARKMGMLANGGFFSEEPVKKFKIQAFFLYNVVLLQRIFCHLLCCV